MNDAANWPGSSVLERLCAEMIALRERNDRQHKVFEQAQSAARDEQAGRYERFAQDIQHAYQQLRETLTGEKRHSLALAAALLEVTQDLERVAAAQPALDGAAANVAHWAESVAVASRKAQAALTQFGVHRFDAVAGDDYQPALHERAGTEKAAGVGPGKIARQLEPGFASSAPDFVLQRARVLVTD